MKWHELTLPPINLLNVPKICGGNVEKMVTITQDEYDELLSDAEFLNYLHAAGVENWDGYDFAREMLEENT